ncbi:amidohydrolase family protein [Phosphitispora fastidiosa]|uniref:amidohydrolase family protein n=1 Tax=Phosphitispora fastidiosa TaxID=2837202 RepID=UPI001E29A13E|nr:amidohydrolase family protein [Phosphitispora fastidiosa]MBU7007189.1 imidazolonepropionase-like amidohydrolase [Phosphitispora fastidiosa]
MKFLKLSSQKDYILIPDMIWDGFSAKPVPGLAVHISSGLITRLAPVEAGAFAGEVIPLPGITLMPGLVDCHVHFSMNSENLFQAIEDWENDINGINVKCRQYALAYLESGVLSVRDGSDRMNIGLRVRNEIMAGKYPGPVVTATGRAIYRKGCYGNFLGPGAASVDEALTQIDSFAGEGIDQLKVVVSGLVSFKEFGSIGAQQFTTAELSAIVNRAHSLGLRVMAHVSSAAAVETAVNAGVDSIEHGYFLETRQLKLMAQQKTAWIPTLAPLGNLVCGGIVPYDGADLRVISESLEIQLARVREAHALGVIIGIGTDAGANHVPHGSSYYDELCYYSNAGLDNYTILSMATRISAQILDRPKLSGVIAPGSKPFLIGVNGNPMKSLEVLKNPVLAVLPVSGLSPFTP